MHAGLAGACCGLRDFRALAIWQRSHAFKVRVHGALDRCTGPGAAHARDQLLRSVSAIPTNIAEGCGKRTEAEFGRYLDIALGSVKETESHLLFARDMLWLDAKSFRELDDELTQIRRMIFAFWRAVRSRSDADAKKSTRPS